VNVRTMMMEELTTYKVWCSCNQVDLNRIRSAAKNKEHNVEVIGSQKKSQCFITTLPKQIG
jgi:hypothetical protein